MRPPAPQVHSASEADVEELRARLGARALRDYPLGTHTTYRVGGAAALGVEVQGADDLVVLRRALEGLAVPVLVVGKGSNLLVADQGFGGLVVRLAGDFEAIEIAQLPQGGGGLVRAGAAVALPQLARRSVEAGLSGLEWAVGVPGSVGGALRMNAGGHGSDVASVLVRYGWLDLGKEAGGDDDPSRLALGYRTSSLEDTQVVLWALFGLAPGDRQRGLELIAEIVRWRRVHQPGGTNAGSVFTNPPGDSAGRLIEAAGLKGFRVGSAMVSPKHANFIQADRGGSANDVYAVMEHVRQEVHARLGVVLRSEVQLVGFPSGSAAWGAEGSRQAAPEAPPGRGAP